MSLTVKCDACAERVELNTSYVGHAILLARQAGWTSTYHFLNNPASSQEHCPACSVGRPLLEADFLVVPKFMR